MSKKSNLCDLTKSDAYIPHETPNENAQANTYAEIPQQGYCTFGDVRPGVAEVTWQEQAIPNGNDLEF
jgi:hypothetical protein